MSDCRLLTTYEVFDYDQKQINEIKERNDGKIMLSGIIQKADTLNQNGRIYPLSVLEREVRNYQKFIIENRAVGETDHPDSCVPTGSEIFTRDGWKKIEDILQGDIVATLNVNTNEIEFQRVLKKIDEPYEGKMYTFMNAKSFNMTVTPRHRVLMWNRQDKPVFMTADEMYDAWSNHDSALSHSSLKRSGNWVGETPEKISVADKVVDSKLWAAFLGIYLAEGHSSGVYAHVRQRSHTIAITQNKGDVADRIQALMDQLPWQYTINESGEKRLDFIIKDVALHAELLPLGGSRQKYVPLYAKNWSPELLNVMLEWMLLGDGRHRYGYKGTTIIPEYCTTSEKLADDVYEIMLKVGHGATIHKYQPVDRSAPDHAETGRMILSENSAPMHIVYQHASRSMSLDRRFMQAKVENYSGKIHCVVTKNQTWLMRQNGNTCWTGNSVINLKNVSHIVREAKVENGVVYGTIEILDKTPCGAILKGLIESGVRLGISSRGVGSTQKKGDYHVVQDDFQLICFDMVSEPSTPGAFMIPEGKKIDSSLLDTVFNKSDRIDRIINDILNYK